MEAIKGSLALDAMGGDMGPLEVVEGLKIALNNGAGKLTQDPILVVGREDELIPALRSVGLQDDPRVRVIHAEEVIGMDEKPMNALKKKKGSSMLVALDLVKAGDAKAILSCGNTGSLMGGGTIKLRPLDGIERPALATIIPSLKQPFVLLDAGANPESTPSHLMQNAILGSNFARAVLAIPKPRVGLLTIGTEEGKGGERIQETHRLLKEIGDVIEYSGLIEGFHLFDSQVDVVVCDGFVGNIVLKSCESLFHVIKDYLKIGLNRNPVRKVGAALCKGAFQEMKAHFSPSEYGGAPLLGLRAPVFKAHGSSNRAAIAGAIKVALTVIQHDISDRILKDLEVAQKRLQLAQPGSPNS